MLTNMTKQNNNKKKWYTQKGHAKVGNRKKKALKWNVRVRKGEYNQSDITHCHKLVEHNVKKKNKNISLYTMILDMKQKSLYTKTKKNRKIK